MQMFILTFALDLNLHGILQTQGVNVHQQCGGEVGPGNKQRSKHHLATN